MSASSSTDPAALIDDLDGELGSGACGIVYALKSAPDRAV